MRLYKSILPCLFTIILLISTCSKRDHSNPLDPNNDQNQNPPETGIKTVEIDTNKTEIIISEIDTTTYHRPFYRLNFQGEIPEIVPGDVLLDKSGRGMIYLVLDTEDLNKSSGTVEALQGTLDLLYKDIEIKVATPENRAKKSFDFDGKLAPTFEIMEFSVNDILETIDVALGDDFFKLDMGGSTFDYQDGNSSFSITLDKGSVTLRPAVDFYAKFGSTLLDFATIPIPLRGAYLIGSLENLKMITYSDLDIDLDVHVNANGNYAPLNKEWPLGKFITTIPAGYIIITIETELLLRASITVDGTIDFNVGYDAQNNILLGMQSDGFTNGTSPSPQFHSDFSSTDNFHPMTLTSQLNIQEQVEIVPRVEVYLYGLLGLSEEIIPYQNFTFNAGSYNEFVDWDTQFSLGLNASIGFDLSIFHFNSLTLKFFGQPFEGIPPRILYSAPHLEYWSGNNQTGEAGQQLDPLRVRAVDSKGNPIKHFPVNVYWQYVPNRVNLDHRNVYTDLSTGIAEATPTLQQGLGGTEVGAFLKTALNGAPHGQVAFQLQAQESQNTPPTAAFTVSPSSGTTETTFRFDASGCSDAEDSSSDLQVRWDWQSDGEWDTDYSQTKVMSHEYDTPGSKTITLQVQDRGGLTGTSTRQIEVTESSSNTPPTASFTISPSSGTTSTTFTFDASSSYDNEDPASALQVRWDWENDGAWDSNFSTTKTARHAYSTAGSKTVKLEVRDNGGLTHSATQQLSVTEDSGGETGTVIDREGNVYKTIKIGDQWWMAENLKVTTYRNGDPIPHVTDNGEWSDLRTGAWCAYDNDPANADTYGLLYNWYAVNDSRNIAPEGWHVPTDEEWKQLEMALGMSRSEADDTGWRGSNEGSKLAGNADLWDNGALKNNAEFGSSGFSGLPGGYRYLDNGYFGSLGYYAYFWSSTEYSSYDAWGRNLSYDSTDVYRYNYDKRLGFSVRCVRD